MRLPANINVALRQGTQKDVQRLLDFLRERGAKSAHVFISEEEEPEADLILESLPKKENLERHFKEI